MFRTRELQKCNVNHVQFLTCSIEYTNYIDTVLKKKHV